MPGHDILFQIALMLLGARLLGEAAIRLGAPALIGEMCAGILVGPSLLGWIHPGDIIVLLAEIGIILLLFEVGLEADVERLLRAGGKSAAVALIGFFAPFLFGYLACRYLFDLDTLVSVFIAGTLTATSIGVTVRILRDVGRSGSREGQVVLGAAVLDDLLGVFLLAILYEFAMEGTFSATGAGAVIMLVLGFFLLAPLAARLVAPAIRYLLRTSRVPGVIPVTLVALVLAMAGLAHVLGAPQLLGGFAAGLALSRRFFLPFGALLRADHEFTERVEREMAPVIQLFTPLFFVTVGLSLELGAVDWGSPFIWVFSLSLAGIAIASKLLAGLLIREPWHLRISIGMCMVPRGEVGLIFAELGRTSGVLDAEMYAGLVLVIAYTTLLSPFWIKLYYSLFQHRFETEPGHAGAA